MPALTEHLSSLDGNPALLERLRAQSLAGVDQITWQAAGQRLLQVYRETITMAQEAQSRKRHELSLS